MKVYLELLEDILKNGEFRKDRTGTGTYGVFGRQFRVDLREGFPLLTTKKIFTQSMIAELLWFLSGSTQVKDLQTLGSKIWDPWADKNGELGPIYGHQWRKFKSGDGVEVDQISELVNSIKKDPYSRRHMVVAWNPGDISKMALPPCHCLFQFYVQDNKLSCQLYQRSCDVFVGLPFNIASYALLTHILALECGLTPFEFIWSGGDVHLYTNHVEAAKLQLSRQPKVLPKLYIKKAPDIFSYKVDDFLFENYMPEAHIKVEVSV